MKETLIFVLEEERRIKERIAAVRKELTFLATEEASITAIISSCKEDSIKEQIMAVRDELVKWSEIEKIASTDTSVNNVKREIKKRKDELSKLEEQIKYFDRLSEIAVKEAGLYKEYRDLAKKFTCACLAVQEAYTADCDENQQLASEIEKELKKYEENGNVSEKEIASEIKEEDIFKNSSEAAEHEEEDVEGSSFNIAKDVNLTEDCKCNDAAKTPLDVLYDFMQKFEEMYVAASKDSNFNESGYLSGYEFLFERLTISEEDAKLFKEAVESEEPFMGLTDVQKKSLLWSVPKAFLKKVGLNSIINLRSHENEDYQKEALNKFRAKFTFGFVVDLMTVIKNPVDEEQITEFFDSNTDTYVKTRRFGIPKAVQKALAKVR